MLDLVVLVGYLLFIVVIGTIAGKFTTNTADFFFGGRRFSWWLVGVSCVATLVGSYSFIQYSEVGMVHGMPSLGPYTNEWFVLPLFLGAWLPIFYYKDLQSVPEYFEKRFDRSVRQLVIIFLLVYLTGYVGVNLLTIGTALRGIMAADPDLAQRIHFNELANIPTFNGWLDWQLIIPAIIIAFLSAIYLHSGGQTSVIITDLLQGFLLLAVGLAVVVLGIAEIGGFTNFWDSLPAGHRYPFGNFNTPANYHFVGDFWNDAVLNSFAFYIINQGILMRFLSARSVHDGRKAMLFVAVFMMPLAAISVGGAGWVGRVLVDMGALQTTPQDVFIAVARLVSVPGVYGLVVAAVVAALMSTLDTLITALAAVVVNDIVKPRHPNQPDEYYLATAKKVALWATVIGVLLIPVFDRFDSIYQALSHFTSVVLPPLVIVVLFGLLVPKFSARAAYWTLFGGAAAMIASMIFPVLVSPVAHGVDPSGGYSFMRALYGLLASVVIGAVAHFVFPRGEVEAEPGLTIFDLESAQREFKGGEPNLECAGDSVRLSVTKLEEAIDGVRLPQSAWDKLALKPGDILYVTDPRWWWGGLHSVHSKALEPSPGENLEISQELFDLGGFPDETKLIVEKVF
jgi:solute:Na+ symporter, SSS family